MLDPLLVVGRGSVRYRVHLFFFFFFFFFFVFFRFCCLGVGVVLDRSLDSCASLLSSL